ncbi:putative quinol monooxygenase [Actinosynnema mirum]|uniref:Antibiotic biosynthesis monooxygenase n=1 Tax=Actinosynnema mirum (strain ATCC 29888 / DSM 43827 / JCM 3225 / NBRC 14064 / NCIMB 13271 / NRRL B-12336 / IMRU 3971 / 101) TaxID=446462 RepID=C6WKA4_ACTMD|nr:antibiotic biosynthesis monooxygenase [Actinosynnema mirum]ACU38317.1 Antibiotic biosynthesis monooxygenase [Actinosynnema mirum DSM 43827]
MLLALVELRATDRPAVLAHFDAERGNVRAMPGNLDFRVCASREDDGRATVLHEWADRAALDGYLASEVFARLGASVRPLLAEPPVSRRFHADAPDVAA